VRKTVYLVFGLVIILTSQIFTVSFVNGLTMPLIDEVDDVFRIENLQPVDRGDFHDELDIINATVESNNLVVTFQAQPIITGGRTYGGYIYWWGANNIFNYTSWRIGLDLLTQSQTNYVDINFAFLTNGSDYGLRLYDVVTMEGNSLVFPILNHSLLPNFPNPPHFFFAAGIVAGNTLTYIDHLPEFYSWTPATTPTTPGNTENGGFVNSLYIFTILSTLAISVRVSKGKNRK